MYENGKKIKPSTVKRIKHSTALYQALSAKRKAELEDWIYNNVEAVACNKRGESSYSMRPSPETPAWYIDAHTMAGALLHYGCPLSVFASEEGEQPYLVFRCKRKCKRM